MIEIGSGTGECFGGPENVVYIDCGGYTAAYNYQTSSNYTHRMGGFYSM